MTKGPDRNSRSAERSASPTGIETASQVFNFADAREQAGRPAYSACPNATSPFDSAIDPFGIVTALIAKLLFSASTNSRLSRMPNRPETACRDSG